MPEHTDSGAEFITTSDTDILQTVPTDQQSSTDAEDQMTTDTSATNKAESTDGSTGQRLFQDAFSVSSRLTGQVLSVTLRQTDGSPSDGEQLLDRIVAQVEKALANPDDELPALLSQSTSNACVAIVTPDTGDATTTVTFLVSGHGEPQRGEEFDAVCQTLVLDALDGYNTSDDDCPFGLGADCHQRLLGDYPFGGDFGSDILGVTNLGELLARLSSPTGTAWAGYNSSPFGHRRSTSTNDRPGWLDTVFGYLRRR